MRALVLSGGGARGAFQVGVIKKLVEKNIHWDVICGVSVGAINAAYLAQFAKVHQKAGVLTLEAFWLQLKGNSSIYNTRPLGFMASLWNGGLYDTSPLKELIRSSFRINMVKQAGIKLLISAVSLNTGKFKTVDENETDLCDWIMASSAFPFAFPPIKIGGEWWVDGGVRNVTPLLEAAKIPNVTDIDVILTTAKSGDVAPWTIENPNAVDVGGRCAGIMADEVYLGDIRENLNSKKNIKIYAPEEPWNDDPLDFDPLKIRRKIECGYNINI